ncbi:hypothetical protein, partial [Bacteroides thetaiotaomicron]|uniref:hypothetical protein n=3 Tax=Bacteroides TaxID=816 RepID=UPI0032C0D8B1
HALRIAMKVFTLIHNRIEMSKKENLVKWKTVEMITPGYPDGVILIKEDTPIEFPLAMVAFPLGGHENGTKKQRERAKLIAAAPELLKALQEMLERFDYSEQSTYSFAAKEIDAAKEAIKKATE